MIMRCVPLLALAALLPACTVGPDYRAPDPGLPQAWTEPANAGTPSEAGWWYGFDDPALEDLIAAALADNIDVRIAAARLVQAGGLGIGEMAEASGTTCHLTPA